MRKTKIEWCDYTINPVKGLCPMACSYCYARRMYKRFKWNPEIRYYEPSDDFYEAKRHPGAKVFIGSTLELFGEWVKPEWLDQIFEYCRRVPATTFIFLTKQPQNLTKWSPFPENCWVGFTATDDKSFHNGMAYYVSTDNYKPAIEANIRFISFEPLLSKIKHSDFDALFFKGDVDWIILGSQTQPIRHPPREWVDEIITAANKVKIPVFVKEPMASHFNIHRQELPL